MKKTIIIITAATLVVAAVFTWRYVIQRQEGQKQMAFILDPSKSKIGGCDCLVERFREQLFEPNNAGATIHFLKLGTAERGYEPLLITSYDVPKNRRILEGRSKTERKKEDIVEEFRSKCNEIERTNVTPLYQSLKRTLEFLRTKGCKPDTACEIFLQTDLIETIEPIQPINKKSSSSRTVQNGVQILDNKGIKIWFVGFAEVITKGKSQSNNDLQNRERWREVWQNLFAQPELVEFSPLCPQVSLQTSKNK